MSAPANPQPQQLTLVHCFGCLFAAAGALAGGGWGAKHHGLWGAVLGAPAGLAVGFVAGLTLLVASVVVLMLGWVLFTYGPGRLWAFVRGRWEPPDDPPPGGDQPNSSGA